MMKKHAFIVIGLVATFVFMSFDGGPELSCSSKELKERTKDLLDPFKYDSSELTRIQFKNKETVKEVEVPLFIGESYRMVFNTEALPKPVEINVYNKDKESKSRKLLFTSKGTAAGQKQFSFEYAKGRKVFINYTIPKTDTLNLMGCVVFMLGYK